MTADLFRFEVPTSRGKFVIIGPDTLTPEETEAVSAKIARLIPLLVNEPVEVIADANGDELEHGQPDFPGQFPEPAG